MAAAAALVATGVAVVAPVSARIAMHRLFVPFGSVGWPQETHLVLDQSATMLKVARGDSFNLSVRVKKGDKIPESAVVAYHFADGEDSGEPLRSAEGGEFRGRIESVNQPFHFSVTAGDDTTSIRDVPVAVVPPPTLKSLTLRLVAPSYTGLPAQVLAPGLTQLRALEGTRLEMDALGNKPLAHAELRVGETPAGSELTFDAARTRFQTSLTVKNNFTFWFDLKDTEGFRNRDAVRYDVRSFPDESPRVLIDEPKSDRDVPADATVPVKVAFDDDFGLHSGRLIYRLATGDSEPHEQVVIPLWAASEPGRDPGANRFVKHQEVAHDWQLEPLKLPVGTLITFYAEARDFDLVKGPKFGKSREIRLRIVSKDDATRQIDDERRELREEIARVLTMQKQAITPVDNAIRSLKDTDRLQPGERDNLNNAGMIQRQINSRINNRDDSAPARIRRILDNLKNFKISNPDAQKQMEDMLARLGVIRDRHLGPAEQELARAVKNLDENAAPGSPAAESRSSNPSAEASKGSNEKRAQAPRMPRLPRHRREAVRRVPPARRLPSVATHRRQALKRAPPAPRMPSVATRPRVPARRVRPPRMQPAIRTSTPSLLTSAAVSPRRAPTPRKPHSPRPRPTRRPLPTSSRKCSMG